MTRLETPSASHAAWRLQCHAALVVARKDVMIYYLKPPVFTFGVVFPAFFFLAFAVGRGVAAVQLVPGVLAMTLFFTASAVGPLITPWERQARTFERLVTSPAALEAILAGDLLAGMSFGIVLSLAALTLGLVLGATATHALALAGGLVLGALAFAALGVLLASTASEAPSQVMMLSNLVRLPLIFVSGVFAPLHEMPVWGQRLALLSPLSYCTDLVRVGFGERGHFSAWTDAAALVGFTALFFAWARYRHRRIRQRAL
jgi:ABC-2 type transport system permease protein